MTLAMVFPGQGSQSPGMQGDLAERFEVVRDTWSEANDALVKIENLRTWESRRTGAKRFRMIRRPGIA